MKRSAPIPGVNFKSLCSGCGQSFSGTGALGNHVRYGNACTPEMRFWGKIRKGDGCWIWQGAANTTGYGMVSWDGRKNIVAHRLAWRLTKGEIPQGMELCHSCDTTRCCNPEHMFLGTHSENMADSKAKKRHAHGERNHHAKLTETQVREIRARYVRKRFHDTNARDLAAEYGIGAGTVHAVAQRRTWRYVK